MADSSGTPEAVLALYLAIRNDAPWERTVYVSQRPVYGQGNPMDLRPLFWNVPGYFLGHVWDLDQVCRSKERELGKEKDEVSYGFKAGAGGLMDIQFVVKYL